MWVCMVLTAPWSQGAWLRWPMSDDPQLEIPPSFIALFVKPGQTKPSASFAHVAQRYDTCEDLANLLTDHAQSQQFKQGGHTDEVLSQCMAGLLSTDSGVDAAEARWVVCRLAELLNWPMPELS